MSVDHALVDQARAEAIELVALQLKDPELQELLHAVAGTLTFEVWRDEWFLNVSQGRGSSEAAHYTTLGFLAAGFLWGRRYEALSMATLPPINDKVGD